MDLTYVELFAGAGGMSLGLETAGWRCVAHAEIEPHARAVLRHHWPDVPLYGDVTELDGTQFKGVTMVTGGSPCQDLSIAGKRAGMVEGSGTRSSLFFEQVRIWNESEAPYILWENVYGAFSSNAGRDFAAVLSALVGAAVPVPSDGWVRAGVVAGPAGVAAWRTLDAQYFGVPQRRRRVFVLGVRAGGVDPAEVFALAESLSGHLAASGEAGEGVATDARRRIASESGAGWWDDSGLARLRSEPGGMPQNVVYATDARRGATSEGLPTVSGTVTAKWAKGVGGPARSASETSNLVVTYSTPAIGDIREDSVASTITKNSGGGGETQNPAFVVFTRQRTDEYAEKDVASTISARDYKSATDIAVVGVPRRLTPVECERLMGWPDQHTSHGVNEKGKAYALADTARYKLCGNGIASPVTAWIGFQMARLLTFGGTK